MSALSFLNPAFLGALSLIAIPILIHLMRRKRIRVIPWAAWEFLLQSRRKNRRRLRIEQLILLILRILIVCLVVLAFTRPLLQTRGLPIVAEDARVHAMIVLDNSFSMGYKNGNLSDFDKGKKVAEDILGRALKQGDSVQIVLLSNHPSALIQEPTYALGKARQELQKATLSDYGTDYAAGALFCAKLLKPVKTPVREVYWITDNQKIGYPGTGDSRLQDAWKELSGMARVTWIDTASPDRENLSVGTPVFSRELITPQAPVRIEAMIHNYTPTARNGLLADLYVDGHAAGSTRVDVPAWGKAQATFMYLFAKPGVHTGSVRLESVDNLAKDNIAWFSVKVRNKLKVLVADPVPTQDPAHDEAFYLVTALSPTGASSGTATSILVTVHPGSKLAGLNLRNYDAVVVTGMTGFTTQDRLALQDFVSNGGGVFLFPGPHTNPGQVNSELGGSNNLLPALLGSRYVYSESNALTLNAASINQPALNSFRNNQDIDLTTPLFTQVFGLKPVAGDSVNVDCLFSNGDPALVERRYGQGKILLSAFPAGISGGTLPFKPAYLPIIQQLVAYLAAGPTSQRNLPLGSTLISRFDVQDAGKPVRVTNPAGNVELINSVLGADGTIATYTHTGYAGIYTFGVAGKPISDAFALNLPSDESDLRGLKNSQVAAELGSSQTQFAHSSEDIMTVVRRNRRGAELWRMMLFIALPLLFLEALLAQRFGRR